MLIALCKVAFAYLIMLRLVEKSCDRPLVTKLVTKILIKMSDFDSFAIIRKYVEIKELTPAIVNEFIKKIIVHAPEKVDGKRVQKVDIVFNFVGEINFLSATQPKRQGA